MIDLLQDLMQDRRIRHIQDRVDGISTSSKMNATAAAREVTVELNQRMNKLLLTNVALMELLIEKTGITEDDIAKKISEVDLRDGKEDGKLNARAALPPAKDCPECDAKICRDFNRCLFCGYEDV